MSIIDEFRAEVDAEKLEMAGTVRALGPLLGRARKALVRLGCPVRVPRRVAVRAGASPEVEQLAAILEQLGVTPEELMEALQSGALQGGGEGAAGGEAGGSPAHEKSESPAKEQKEESEAGESDEKEKKEESKEAGFKAMMAKAASIVDRVIELRKTKMAGKQAAPAKK